MGRFTSRGIHLPYAREVCSVLGTTWEQYEECDGRHLKPDSLHRPVSGKKHTRDGPSLPLLRTAGAPALWTRNSRSAALCRIAPYRPTLLVTTNGQSAQHGRS